MEIDISKPEGNAHGIMGIVGSLLKQTGRRDEWPAIRKRMKSGDYQNLCDIATEVSYGSITFIDGRED